MTNRRRLGIAAVTVTSAALAILGVGGGALASNVAAPGQIKACYKTGTTLPPLTHIATSGKCPTGNSTLIWNKVGPQGPAGVSVWNLGNLRHVCPPERGAGPGAGVVRRRGAGQRHLLRQRQHDAGRRPR